MNMHWRAKPLAVYNGFIQGMCYTTITGTIHKHLKIETSNFYSYRTSSTGSIVLSILIWAWPAVSVAPLPVVKEAVAFPALTRSSLGLQLLQLSF